MEDYKDFSKCKDWQILIFIGNKNQGGKTNWDGGAFVIKNHIGQSIIKGCFSWHAENKELSTLLTIREALYASWKEGYRKAILFVSTERLAKTMQTTISNRKNIEIIMEDLRTRKNMLHNLYSRVAQTPILQKAQDLAKEAAQTFMHTIWS